MNKIIVAASLIFLVQNTIGQTLPDAIRCGNEGAIYIVHQAQQTKMAHYCQIYSGQDRCVTFNTDGSYYRGTGHYDSRKGCQNKSLATLDKEGRTIYYALDLSKGNNQAKQDGETLMKNKIAKLEQQDIAKEKKIAKLKVKMEKMEEQEVAKDKKIAKLEESETFMKYKMMKIEEELSQLKKKQSSANFWDYEQIKQIWVKDFKREMMAEIKEKGIQIGLRWRLQQEGNSFVIRDFIGSSTKDSRIAFAADTYSNPK